MKPLNLIALLGTLSLSSPALAVPGWAKTGTQSLNGSILRVVCSGTGPSVDLARREAEQGCKASAAGKLITSGRVITVTVETERDIGLHQQVTEDISFRNLACTPEREEIEPADGQMTVWLRCRFDLAKASTAPQAATVTTDTPIPQDQVGAVKDRRIRAPGGHSEGAATASMSISSIPPCDDVLIYGAKPRVVRCVSNPLSIVVDRGDSSAVVRAKGFQPKTIDLNGNGRSYEALQVILEPN